MEWLNLIGIVIVIVGFARKWNSILVILLAAGATGLVSGISPVALLETIGTTFVANRNMAIFILVMLVTGTLERNGLRERPRASLASSKARLAAWSLAFTVSCARSSRRSTSALAAWPAL